DDGALLQHEAALPQRMHGRGAKRILGRDRTEFHFSAPPGCRKRAVISAMMATAISAGDTAPMESPIGEWMRAMPVSLTPCSFSRVTRRACVFFEPSAPI